MTAVVFVGFLKRDTSKVCCESLRLAQVWMMRLQEAPGDDLGALPWRRRGVDGLLRPINHISNSCKRASP